MEKKTVILLFVFIANIIGIYFSQFTNIIIGWSEIGYTFLDVPYTYYVYQLTTNFNLNILPTIAMIIASLLEIIVLFRVATNGATTDTHFSVATKNLAKVSIGINIVAIISNYFVFFDIKDRIPALVDGIGLYFGYILTVLTIILIYLGIKLHFEEMDKTWIELISSNMPISPDMPIRSTSNPASIPQSDFISPKQNVSKKKICKKYNSENNLDSQRFCGECGEQLDS